MRKALLLPPLLALSVFTACSSSDDTGPEPQGCDRFNLTLSPQTSSGHVSLCDSAACGNGENPPNTGPHCPVVAACGTYEEPVPRCNWVHNLEHGHVVFLYNCPEGCPDEVAKLVAASEKARQGSNGVRRAIVAPDPQLPQRVAAMVWRRTYLADSADPEALQCVLNLQDVNAPEPGLLCPQ